MIKIENILSLANAFINSGGILAKVPTFCLNRACEITVSMQSCSCQFDSESMATVILDGTEYPVSYDGKQWVTGWI